MADLSVQIHGLTFRNPVIPAAGPNVRDGIRVVEAVHGGCGAALSKTISVDAAPVPMPHMAEVRGGFINTELWSEMPPERWLATEFAICRAAADEAGIPLICSLGYTGQEIVARTHYLGKVKRRTQLAHIASSEAPKPGDDIFSADGNEPVGKLVRVATAPQGGFDVLAEIRLGSLEAGRVRWNSTELEISELPYSLAS